MFRFKLFELEQIVALFQQIVKSSPETLHFINCFFKLALSIDCYNRGYQA